MDARTTARSGEEVLRAGVPLALDYALSIDERRVAPDARALAGLEAFDEPLPEAGLDEHETLRLLHAAGSPATMATTSARHFGFVNGATPRSRWRPRGW